MIDLTPSQLQAIAAKVKELLSADSQGVGEVPVVTTLDGILSLPALKRSVDSDSVVEAPLTLLRVSLRKTETHIEWRQGDAGSWYALVSIADISAKNPEFRTSSVGIEWRLVGKKDDPWIPLVDFDDIRLKFSMLTQEEKEEIRGYSSFQLWQQEPGNAQKTYEQYKAYLKHEVTVAAEECEKGERGRVLAEDTRVKQEKDRVTTDSQRKADYDSLKLEVNAKVVELDTKVQAAIEVKDQTLEAVRNAQTATSEANSARDAANTATAKADAAAAGAITATSEANSARDAANTATAKAVAATSATNAAISNAETATADANAAKSQTLQAIVDAETATLNAQTATAKADTAAGSANTQASFAAEQGARAKEQADHPPKMGQNGNWWQWSDTLKDYVDTGVLAKGGVLYPDFDIDPETMELVMTYQDEVVADMFNIDEEGYLTFNPK